MKAAARPAWTHYSRLHSFRGFNLHFSFSFTRFLLSVATAVLVQVNETELLLTFLEKSQKRESLMRFSSIVIDSCMSLRVWQQCENILKETVAFLMCVRGFCLFYSSFVRAHFLQWFKIKKNLLVFVKPLVNSFGLLAFRVTRSDTCVIPEMPEPRDVN